jgi:hypothetical protein
MVDEARLEVGQHPYVVRPGQVVLGVGREVRRERRLDHLPGEGDQRHRVRRRRVDEQVPGEQPFPTLVVGHRRVEVQHRHRGLLR